MTDEAKALVDERLKTIGACALTYNDGQLVIISMSMLAKLLLQCDEAGTDRVAIFIQDSSKITPEVLQ